MILFDTSIWIDHFNRSDSSKSNHLSWYLQRYSQKIAVNATIIQEVLQGAKNDNLFDIYEDVLLSVKCLEFDPVEAAIEAAKLYRSLRKKGVTIRKPNDCLIAIYAIHFDVELCHNDSDFDLIVAHSVLKIWKG
jgi:predicted nucleic acid-binding protein